MSVPLQADVPESSLKRLHVHMTTIHQSSTSANALCTLSKYVLLCTRCWSFSYNLFKCLWPGTSMNHSHKRLEVCVLKNIRNFSISLFSLNKIQLWLLYQFYRINPLFVQSHELFLYSVFPSRFCIHCTLQILIHITQISQPIKEILL